MKKSFVLLLLLLFSIMLFGCQKDDSDKYKTPELMPFEVSDNACKNLVIFIGDGMGPEHVKAGQLVYNTTYDFTSWDHTFSNTYSYSDFVEDYVEITDSAAGGTAIATGKVTYNSYVGKDINGNDLATILDYAKKMGKKTGVVTTDVIYGATPSDFSGHAINRSETQTILDAQIHSNVDLFIGQFSDEVKNRKSDLEASGYTYYASYEETGNINESEKAWCQFAFKESSGNVSLKEATELAVNYLSTSENGYVLMVEAAHIDKYSHDNNFKPAADAVNELNYAIDYVKSNANGDTAIIISADHETGSLDVSDEDIYTFKYENITYRFASGSHSGTPVDVYIYGFTVDFSEFSLYGKSELIKNKDIFRIALYSITGYIVEDIQG